MEMVQGLALLRRQQKGFGKTGQSAQLPGTALLGAGQIDLHHLPARETEAHIFLLRHPTSTARGSTPQPRHSDLKTGVGQAVSEGKLRLYTKAVKIPVAHIDTLPVDRFAQVAAEDAEVVRLGIVTVAPGPRWR